MSKRKTYTINLDCEEFKKIKKNKQNIISCLNNNEFEDIKLNDKIILKNGNKKLKKKVKQLYKYSTFEELRSNVKNKKKEDIEYINLEKNYSKEDIIKYGVLGIEVKTKKHILLKMLLGIILIILILLVISFMNNKLAEIKDKKINSAINNLVSEKTDYVFVEINPKLLLIVQDGKVNNVYCMNHDCKNFYNDIHVKNLDAVEAINQIYLLANKKGFDTSNGVKIKSTTYIPVEKYDYDFIEIEYIKEEEKNKLLTEVLENSINNDKNGDYYDDLLSNLKKDDDYDKFYSCKKENNELSCGFIMSSIKAGFDIESIDVLDFDSLFSNKNDVLRILKKFNFNVTGDIVRINNVNYNYSISFTYNGTNYGNILYRELTEKLSDELCEYTNDDSCIIKTGYEFIKLSDINLLEPVIPKDKLIIKTNDIKKNIEEQYNLLHQFELESKKEQENIKKECISKGYHLEKKTYCDEETCIEQDMWCRQESNSFVSCRTSCEDIN